MKPTSNRRQFFAKVGSGACIAYGWTQLPIAVADERQIFMKTIFIAADDHTDYMWTADEETYRRAFLRMIEHYLDLADRTDRDPPDFQSRWNCDGLFWFREFEQNRNETQVNRLVARVKSGHISFPMTMLVSCYGGAPTEAVLRGLYYAGHLERKYGLRFRMAVSMENQTLPLGLATLWHGSGVRYSWKGICGCATKLGSAGNREHDVYWWQGKDGSRILMKWYSLLGPVRDGIYANEGPGGYAEARDPTAAIRFVETDEEFLQKNPHDVIGLFGHGWDDLETTVPLEDETKSFPFVARNLSNKERRVVVSNEQDYFELFEQRHGKSLPVVESAYGNEWDLYSASLAEVSASVRRACEKLRSAEAMACLVLRYHNQAFDKLRESRDQAWVALGLYWEHDWTADGPVSREERAKWQRKIASQINAYVDALFDQARDRLAGLIPSKQKTKRISVFNPLGHIRTDVSRLPLADGESVEVFDLRNASVVESQVIVEDGQRILVFMARDLPAMGYRIYELRTTQDAVPLSGTRRLTQSTIVKSKRYQVTFNPRGEIESWVDRRSEVEWVNPLRVLNEWIGVDGVARDTTVRVADAKLESGPVCVIVTLGIGGAHPRSVRFVLYHELDRLEIENTIKHNFADVRAWRFGWNLKTPNTIHEEVGAIVDAASHRDGGDYADANARTDWLTLNHFVAMTDGQKMVSLSNRDCAFFHLGNYSLDQQMDPDAFCIAALAGGQVDGTKLGIRRQGGDTRFAQHFACNPVDDHGAAMRRSLEHQNPLVTTPIRDAAFNDSERPLPATEYAGLKLNSSQVQIWAVKAAEDGIESGLIVRLWNVGDQSSRYKLSVDGKFHSCRIVSHIETDAGDEPQEDGARELQIIDGTVTETLNAGALRTLRFV